MSLTVALPAFAWIKGLRRLTSSAFAALVVVAATACSAPTPAVGDQAARVVNVYTSRHYDADRQLYALFEERTGIAVRVQEKRGEELQALLEAEGEASPADLIVTVDAGNLYRLQEAGLLAPVTSEALTAAVPARYRDPEGRWYGFSRRARVIAYRSGVIAPEAVSTMAALTAPGLRGRVCARSSTNPYNLSMLSARIAREGEAAALAWAQGVTANFARDPRGGDTDQLRAIAAGECDVAIVNHYYLLRLQRSTDPADQAVAAALAIQFPDQAEGQPGAHVNISGAGVAAHAPHPAEALALLEFLVSAEAQSLLATLNEEFPVSLDAPAPAELAAIGALREEEVPLSALGQHQAQAAQIFETAGWR
jgi:iron(III) transport system substrate-binding protein